MLELALLTNLELAEGHDLASEDCHLLRCEAKTCLRGRQRAMRPPACDSPRRLGRLSPNCWCGSRWLGCQVFGGGAGHRCLVGEISNRSAESLQPPRAASRGCAWCLAGTNAARQRLQSGKTAPTATRSALDQPFEIAECGAETKPLTYALTSSMIIPLHETDHDNAQAKSTIESPRSRRVRLRWTADGDRRNTPLLSPSVSSVHMAPHPATVHVQHSCPSLPSSLVYVTMTPDRPALIHLQVAQRAASSGSAPAEVTWHDLPDCVAARILRTALHDSGSALVQWLRFSTVCRCCYHLVSTSFVTRHTHSPFASPM